jgi:type IV pilus assembly protein PilM
MRCCGRVAATLKELHFPADEGRTNVMLSSKRNNTSIVGLDIEADSIAAAEVRINGSISVGETAIAPLASGIAHEGEIADPEGLTDALKMLFTEHKLPRNVRVGVANQRVVVRTLRMPAIENRDELETAVRFQAADHIPMALSEAVLDWQVLEDDVELRKSGQMDVVVVAARRQMVSTLVEAMRDAGLRPVGIDISAFGMIRALADDGSAPAPAPAYEDRVGDEPVTQWHPARLLCNFSDTTNLAVARGSSCLFTRMSHFGMEGIIERLSEGRGLTLEHARQWLLYVGLQQPTETLEGDPDTVSAAREALVEGVSKLAGELRLSLDYYGAQEGALDVEEIVICGAGSAIEGIAEHVQANLGYAVRSARPLALAHLDPRDAARLTLPYGLGLEE